MCKQVGDGTAEILQVNDNNDVVGFASRETLKEPGEGCLEAVLLVDLGMIFLDGP